MLRVLFAGSPAIAVPSLRALTEAAKGGAPWAVAGVLSGPDKARGRSGRAEPSDVGAAAEAAGLPVIKAETLDAAAREAVRALAPGLLVSFAYGRVFGPKFRALFPLGGVNVHPSLLPRYRGPSPLQEAILRRDRETGVCVQTIAAELDAGDILASGPLPLSGRETFAALAEAAGAAGARLLLDVLARTAAAGALPPGAPQRGEPSYCSLITKERGRIDWRKSAVEIDALIRAYNPWPLAWTRFAGRTLAILEAAPYSGGRAGDGAAAGRVLGIDKKCGILVQTGGGVLAVSRLQAEARKALPFREFLNGTKDFLGGELGAEDE